MTLIILHNFDFLIHCNVISVITPVYRLTWETHYHWDCLWVPIFSRVTCCQSMNLIDQFRSHTGQRRWTNLRLHVHKVPVLFNPLTPIAVEMAWQFRLYLTIEKWRRTMYGGESFMETKSETLLWIFCEFNLCS